MLSINKNSGPQIRALIRLPQDSSALAADINPENPLKTRSQRPKLLKFDVRRVGQSSASMHNIQHALQQRHPNASNKNNLQHLSTQILDLSL